ncbi:MAG: alkaline phosphatase family protein [Thermoanaerobaculia bacterium]
MRLREKRWISGVLFLLLAGCGSSVTSTPAKEAVSAFGSAGFKHVFVIVLENANADEALRQPFLAKLAHEGAYLARYYAVAHPSQPNYIALVSGSTDGVPGDGPVTLDRQHLGDLLDRRHLTWKSYAEGYPGHCSLAARSGDYARKHEPFISFDDVQSSPVECAHIVAASTLQSDIETGNLAAFSLYVPNMKHDGHDTSVVAADRWLASAFGPRLSDPRFTKDLLFVVTFDEAERGGSNRVYTVLWGDSVKPGTVSNAVYDHYDLLRTIEVAFGLGTLGTHDEDPTTRPIGGIWK